MNSEASTSAMPSLLPHVAWIMVVLLCCLAFIIVAIAHRAYKRLKAAHADELCRLADSHATSLAETVAAAEQAARSRADAELHAVRAAHCDALSELLTERTARIDAELVLEAERAFRKQDARASLGAALSTRLDAEAVLSAEHAARIDAELELGRAEALLGALEERRTAAEEATQLLEHLLASSARTLAESRIAAADAAAEAMAAAQSAASARAVAPVHVGTCGVCKMASLTFVDSRKDVGPEGSVADGRSLDAGSGNDAADATRAAADAAAAAGVVLGDAVLSTERAAAVLESMVGLGVPRFVCVPLLVRAHTRPLAAGRHSTGCR